MMRINWVALLPSEPAPVVPSVQAHEAKAGVAGGCIDGDREAWEERAAIFEFDAGFDRDTAEAMATAEFNQHPHAVILAGRSGDGLHLCPECVNYQGRTCAIAKPGGLVSARRGYEPVPDLLRHCEGFAARSGRDITASA